MTSQNGSYWKLEGEAALGRILQRTRFVRGYGPLVRQSNECSTTQNVKYSQ
jgi:hypothetical protein